MLEAMRILKQVYPNPRARFFGGHWSGEEQGLNGSRGYVHDHPESRATAGALSIRTTHRPRRKHERVGIPDAGASLGVISPACPPTSPEHQVRLPRRALGGGTDHASFRLLRRTGIRPWLGRLGLRRYTWNTNRDTYDRSAGTT